MNLPRTVQLVMIACCWMWTAIFYISTWNRYILNPCSFQLQAVLSNHKIYTLVEEMIKDEVLIAWSPIVTIVPQATAPLKCFNTRWWWQSLMGVAISTRHLLLLATVQRMTKPMSATQPSLPRSVMRVVRTLSPPRIGLNRHTRCPQIHTCWCNEYQYREDVPWDERSLLRGESHGIHQHQSKNMNKMNVDFPQLILLLKCNSRL